MLFILGKQLIPGWACFKTEAGTTRIRPKFLTTGPPGKLKSSIALIQLLCIQLFVTPQTVACQASLSLTISQHLLKLMSIELVMPSNHLILTTSSPPAFNLSQHQGLF